MVGEFELRDYHIRRIVQDSTYVGCIKWGGESVYDENHVALDKELFERAQRIRKEIARRYSRRGRNNQKISEWIEQYGAAHIRDNWPVVYCSKCGSLQLQSNGTEGGRWKFLCKCGHEFRFPPERIKKSPFWREKDQNEPQVECDLKDDPSRRAENKDMPRKRNYQGKIRSKQLVLDDY